MPATTSIKEKLKNPVDKKHAVTYRVEFIAALSTYLTLSYILILNPILLHKAGINISAAFFATVISAAFATLLMGIWAKVPFAVASAPSVTTFFVSYVVLQLGLPWQAALTAVIISGIFSYIAAILSIRQNLINAIPTSLRVGLVFAVCGFLIGNGLTQAKLISYSGGLIDTSSFKPALLISHGAIVLYTGLLVTLLFRLKWLKFAGAPLLGIFAASLVAAHFGIISTTKAKFSTDMFSAIGRVDFGYFLDARFWLAMLVFTIIDFYGGVGKFVGLFAAMGKKTIEEIDEKGLGRALKVDGIGTAIGGFLGTSSLAVFISSAVGIAAGGRTGLTAIVTAGFILLSLIYIPIIGAIPVQATSGILVFIAFLLIPYDLIFDRKSNNEDGLTKFDIVICSLTALVSFLTYQIDKAILFVFFVYTAVIIWKRVKNKDLILIIQKDLILIITTALLLVAVVAEAL